MSDLADRLRTIEDRLAIEHVLHEYFRCIADRDAKGLRACLADDVCIDNPKEGGQKHAADAVVAKIAGITRDFGVMQHYLTNVQLWPEGDEARLLAKLIVVIAFGSGDESRIVQVGTEHKGQCRRFADGAWRIQSLTIEHKWASGDYQAEARREAARA